MIRWGKALFLPLLLVILISCQSQQDVLKTTFEKNSSIEPQNIFVNSTQSFTKDLLNTYSNQVINTAKLEQQQTIHPDVQKQINEKKQERIKILIRADSQTDLDQLREKIKQSNGEIKDTFDVGNTIVAEVPADTVQNISEEAHVATISQDEEYTAFDDGYSAMLGLEQAHQSNFTGKGERIAILDTGIETAHPVFENTTIISQSFVQETAEDQNGHGTHVAGIIERVAPDVEILNAKVLDKSGKGTTTSLLAGINWALNPDGDPTTDDGANIISLSLGKPTNEFDSPLAEAINEAIAKGVKVVAAAGNCKTGCGGFYGVSFPGSMKDVITIGATDSNQQIASFSSSEDFEIYTKPDYVAPGVNVESAWIGGQTAIKSGTSMATPFVSGLLALHTTLDTIDISGLQLLKVENISVEPEFNITEFVRNMLILEEDEFIYNLTFLNETEDSGTYIVFNKKGENQTVSYRLFDNENNSNYDEQIISPSTAAPGSRISIIAQFHNYIPYSSSGLNPSAFYYVVRGTGISSSQSLVKVALSSSQRNAVNSGQGFSMTVYYTIPSTASGTANIFAWLVDSAGYSYDPILWDDSGELGKNMQIASKITCSKNSDCPNTKWLNNQYCSGNYVKDTERDYFCANPGTSSSYCDYDDTILTKQTCAYGCTNGVCNSCSPDLQTDNNNCGSCGTVCGSGKTCSGGSCVPNTCSSYQNTNGPCSQEGTGQRIGNDAYECKDQIWIGQVLCWQKTSSLGNSDFCSALSAFGQKCNYQEYDCDWNSECSTNYCTGDFTSDGCCNSGEIWDSGQNKCLKPNGASCSQESECSNNYCVHNKCSSTLTVCGDSFCDSGETPASCSTDCYGKLQVVKITSAPSTASQGQMIAVSAEVQNTGTYTDTLNLEAGIIPQKWFDYGAYEYGDEQYGSITKCCTGNDYYSAVSVTLAPGAKQTIPFSIKTPTYQSIDACDKGLPKRTAWDSKHKVVVGLYNQCGQGYASEDSEDISISAKQCNYDSDCGANARCVRDSTTSTHCEPKLCSDVCDLNNPYTCSSGVLSKCSVSSTTGCAVKTDTVCSSPSICQNGKSTCQTPAIKTGFSIEDADRNVIVNKQPGDFVTVNLKFNGQENVIFEHSSKLTPQNCQDNFVITKDTSCKFQISGDAGGKITLGLQNGDVGTIRITPPSILYVTNKQKLTEAYGNGQDVKDLLKNVYQKASIQNGAVYYVEDYVSTKHPFTSLSSYNEDPFTTNINNDYALDVANLIRSKCDRCTSTIIIGDDYIIPQYRRTVDVSTWFGFSSQNDLIRTDIPYISRTQKTFAELDSLFYDGDYEGKDVLFILPDGLSSKQRSEIERLKQAFEVRGLHPDVDEIQGSSVTCTNSIFWDRMNGDTLIVVGTEKTNKALSCFPFVASLENDDSAFIEKNPWDGRNYAVVINSDKENVLEVFTTMIASGAYKKLTSENIYFIDTGLTTLSFASMICPGICDTVVDGIDAGFQCFIKQDTIGCAVSTPFVFIPFIPTGPVKVAVHAFIDTLGEAGGKFFAKYPNDAVKLFGKLLKEGTLEEFEQGFKKLSEHFGSSFDEIRDTLKWSIKDEELAVNAVSLAEKSSINLNKVAVNLAEKDKAQFLRNTGAFLEKDSETAKNLLKQSNIPGRNTFAQDVASDIAGSGNLKEGLKWEVNGVQKIIDDGEEFVASSVKFNGGEIDGITKSNKLLEFKSGSYNDVSFQTKLLSDLENQYVSYGKYMTSKGLSNYERVVVFQKGIFNEALTKQVEQIGWKVMLK